MASKVIVLWAQSTRASSRKSESCKRGGGAKVNAVGRGLFLDERSVVLAASTCVVGDEIGSDMKEAKRVLEQSPLTLIVRFEFKSRRSR